MIVGVGFDLVEIERVRAVYLAHPRRFVARCFHPDELTDLVGRDDLVPGLAARFAAKEAFQKVWRRPLGWRDAWVVKDGPAPVLAFSPKLQAALAAESLVCHLSLTHSRTTAGAVVILERSGSLPSDGAS